MAEPGSAKKASAKPSSESKSDTAKTPKEEPTEGPKNEPRMAAVSTIEPETLEGFEHYAPQVQQLVRDALALTKLNLTYTFGSSNPKQGGMDCSGTIYYLLKEHGFKDVPRQSDDMCGWVQKQTLLHRPILADSLKHAEFSALLPGDLLFWSGTYEAGPRTIPVTHVMLYLGKQKKTGRQLMFGASDGRMYQGERRTGVSVFDFTLPKEASKSKFYGYGMIPGVGRIVPKVPEPPVVASAPEPAPAKPTASTEAPKTAPAKSVASTEAPKAMAEPKVAEAKTAETTKPAPAKTTPAEAEETIKKAIVMKDNEPEPATSTKPTTTSSASKSSTTTASKPKASSSSTSKVVTKKSGSSGSNSKKKTPTTTTASRSRSQPPPPPSMETKIRQKAREVGSSLKDAFRR